MKKRMNPRAVPAARKVLGMRLRALRHQRRLSQERLGEKSGLSGKFIGEVERGEKSISIDSLWRVAKALGVPLGDFLDIEQPTSPEREKILALLTDRSPAVLKRVIGILEAFF